MFARRKKHTFLQRLREMIWPRQGMLRTISYYWHRINRLPGSTYSISAGIASGVSMSIMPLGISTVFAGLLALSVRGNIAAALIVAAIIGNPFFAGPIAATEVALGNFILGGLAEVDRVVTISLTQLFSDPVGVFKNIGLSYIVGTLTIATVSWPIIYFSVYRAVDRFRKRRLERMKRRQTVSEISAVDAGDPKLL